MAGGATYRTCITGPRGRAMTARELERRMVAAGMIYVPTKVEDPTFNWMTGRYDDPPDARDPEAHMKRDGEWHAIVTMPHEVAEHEGYAVPAWEGDVERREWEERHGRPD